jgi:hypothetical protein
MRVCCCFLCSPIAERIVTSQKTQLAPLQPPSKTGKRKKKRVGLKGEILEDVGRMDASHSDWLTAAVNSGGGPGSSAQHSITAETGTSLLIDVPQGINDTIERLMHAAALRCYVPDFFQGVSGMPDHSPAEDGADAVLDSLDDASTDETKVEQLLLQRKQRQQENPNSNADYAYGMYLKMPFGLAKMRYELQCKKYAQGPINRLRLRGLSYLADVHPISKFIMCLRSVETPRVLLNKCVDVYLELRAIGKAAPVGAIDRASESKFHRSVHTSQGSLPAAGLGATQGGSAPQLQDGRSSPTATGTLPDDAGGLAGDEGPMRSRSVQFASSSVRGAPILGAGTSMKASTSSLRKGEIGFDSVAEGEFMDAGQSTTELHNTSSVATTAFTGFEKYLEPSFPDTAEGRTAQKKYVKHQNELPGKMLLSVVENQDQLSWCDLRAPVEDIFLQAAFLVVPHVSYVPDLSGMRSGSTSGKGNWAEQRSMKAGSLKMKRVESTMGNHAFKQHTAEVLKMTDENQKREAIKERFRAAFILTTPFTLYLKGKRVYTVDDLLRVNLRDLAMPPALETQLEVLLTAVVSKCVDAKIVPIPRDHVATAAELFTVPMFYDPKFQRSPLDPFGRPPRLQQKGSHRLVQKKLKATERRDNVVNKAHNNMNKVASVESIQEHLNQPVTLWTSSGAVGSEGAVHLQESIREGENEDDGDYHGDNSAEEMGLHVKSSLQQGSMLSLGASLLDDSVLDGKWSFHADNADAREGISRPDTRQGATPKSGRRSGSRGTQRSGADHSETEAPAGMAAQSTVERVRTMMENSEITLSNDNNVWKKSLRSYNPDATRSPPKLRKDTKQFSQDADMMTRNIEDKVFKHTFVCTHPHCGQVFARQYTYNIHLKSHELFGQYHDYKKQPQLFLDKDRAQVQATKEKQFEDRISLPPLVQAELQGKSFSR